jgi:hypothetical protein
MNETGVLILRTGPFSFEESHLCSNIPKIHGIAEKQLVAKPTASLPAWQSIKVIFSLMRFLAETKAVHEIHYFLNFRRKRYP